MEDFAQQPAPLPPKQQNPWFLVGIIVLVVIAMVPPAAIVISKAVPATTAIASPLATGESTVVSPIADISNSPATPKPSPYSPTYYIALSQRYFADAQTLSQNRQQSDEDKKEIIAKLQLAINTISEGIVTYPTRADLWVERANIYMAIKSIAPQAEQAAIQDIQVAQRLTQHSFPNPPNTPNLPNGLELVKDQQAIARNVIVAAPDETPSPYTDTKEGSAFSGTATIPAGQTTMIIPNINVTDASPIYVVPTTQTSATISVISKKAGESFTVTLDSAQTTDVPFQYWVTR